MTMKTSRVFWGVLFVAAGGLLLLLKLDIVTFEVGSYWRFWPVLIVLWGIGILTGVRALKIAAAVIAALYIALLLYEGAAWSMGDRNDWQTSEQKFVENADTSVHQVSFHFASGAGKFHVMDTCASLLDAEVSSNVGEYDFHSSTSDGRRDIHMDMSSRHGGWGLRAGKNRVEMSLNPSPAWDLAFDIGAAQLDLDLSRFLIDNLDIHSGAGEVKVTLGKRGGESRVNVKAGASSIVIRVPESAGCEADVQSALSSKRLEGMKKDEQSGKYRSENFTSAARKIHITIQAGVSSVSVQRY
jgi:predicted membrane protein